MSLVKRHLPAFLIGLGMIIVSVVFMVIYGLDQATGGKVVAGGTTAFVGGIVLILSAVAWIAMTIAGIVIFIYRMTHKSDVSEDVWMRDQLALQYMKEETKFPARLTLLEILCAPCWPVFLTVWLGVYGLGLMLVMAGIWFILLCVQKDLILNKFYSASTGGFHMEPLTDKAQSDRLRNNINNPWWPRSLWGVYSSFMDALLARDHASDGQPVPVYLAEKKDIAVWYPGPEGARAYADVEDEFVVMDVSSLHMSDKGEYFLRMAGSEPYISLVLNGYGHKAAAALHSASYKYSRAWIPSVAGPQGGDSVQDDCFRMYTVSLVMAAMEKKDDTISVYTSAWGVDGIVYFDVLVQVKGVKAEDQESEDLPDMVEGDVVCLDVVADHTIVIGEEYAEDGIPQETSTYTFNEIRVYWDEDSRAVKDEAS